MRIYGAQVRRRSQRIAAPVEDVNAPLVMPWWLSPEGMVLGFLLPTLLLVAYSGDAGLPGLTVRGYTFLSTKWILLGIMLLVVMAMGGWIGTRIRPSAPIRSEEAQTKRAALALGWMVLTVYVFAFREVLFSPGTMVAVLQGWRPPRTGAGRVAGITSLTNAGPPFFALIGYMVFVRRMVIGRHLIVLTAALGFCFFFRSYFWSERVALIEAVVPLGLTWIISPGGRTPRLKRFLRMFGPYIAVPMVLVYFAAGEYFRSWQSDYYNNGSRNFIDFAVGRFATYYYTSLNNGAGALAVGNWPNYEFSVVLEWLHKFPLGVGQAFKGLVNDLPRNGFSFLDNYGDPEFNNPSGIFSVVGDVGIAGAMIYFGGGAIIGGMLFRRLGSKGLDGAVFYPLFVMGLLELYRYAYWSASRALPWYLFGFLVLWFATRKPRRQSFHMTVRAVHHSADRLG